MHACQIDRNFYQHPNKEGNGPSLFIGPSPQGHAQQANTCALPAFHFRNQPLSPAPKYVYLRQGPCLRGAVSKGLL